jgi:hypothetical protein
VELTEKEQEALLKSILKVIMGRPHKIGKIKKGVLYWPLQDYCPLTQLNREGAGGPAQVHSLGNNRTISEDCCKLKEGLLSFNLTEQRRSRRPYSSPSSR